MAGGKMYRYTKKRKTARSYRRSNRRLNLMKSPVPQKMLTKFRYNTTISLNPGAAGIVAEHVFTATGLYDPDSSGVGHQPRGFDQFIGVLYDHYVVLGAKLTATIDNSSNTQPCFILVKAQDSAQTTTTRTDWFEDTYTNKRVCSGSGGPSHVTITKKVNTSKFLTRSKILSDPELKGSASANPTENIFYHVGACPVDDSLDLNAVSVNVDIEFITMMIERRNPVES